MNVITSDIRGILSEALKKTKRSNFSKVRSIRSWLPCRLARARRSPNRLPRLLRLFYLQGGAARYIIGNFLERWRLTCAARERTPPRRSGREGGRHLIDSNREIIDAYCISFARAWQKCRGASLPA